MKYLIVVEQTDTGFSAYCPDVPGCVVAAATQPEVEREMTEAVSFHLEGLRSDGVVAPEPHASVAYVNVPA